MMEDKMTLRDATLEDLPLLTASLYRPAFPDITDDILCRPRTQDG
jgi:hypothetical protein